MIIDGSVDVFCRDVLRNFEPAPSILFDCGAILRKIVITHGAAFQILCDVLFGTAPSFILCTHSYVCKYMARFG